MFARLSPLRMKGGTPAAAPPAPSGIGLSANLADANYYSMQDYHINILHDANHQSWQEGGDAYVNPATGYPVDMPPETQWRRLIKFSVPPEKAAAMRQGAWKVVCGGGGWDIEIVTHDTPSGIVNIVNGTDEATFDVDHTQGGIGFSVRGINNTAGNLSVPRGSLKIYAVANETLLNSGEIFDPAVVTDLSYLDDIRFAGIIGTMAPPLGVWQGVPSDDTWITGPWPVKQAARLALKLGCGIYYNPPAPMDVLYYTCDATTNRFAIGDYYGTAPSPFPWSEGDLVSIPLYTPVAPGSTIPRCGNYYVRNISGDTFQLSATVDGSILDVENTITTSNDERYAYLMTKLYDYPAVCAEAAADIMEVYPAVPFIKVGGFNETWNTGGGFFWNFAYCVGPMHLAATGTINDGNGSAYGHSYSSLLVWKAFIDEFGSEKVIRQYEAATSPFSGGRADGLDYVDTQGIVDLDEPMYNIAHRVVCAPYIYPHTSTPDGYGGYVAYNMASYIAAEAWNWSDATWKTAFDYGMVGLLAALDQWEIAIAARNPALVMDAYEGGQHAWQNINITTGSDEELVMEAYRDYYFTTRGQPVWEMYKTDIMEAYGFQSINYLHWVGAWQYPTTNYFEQWGTKPFFGSAYNTDLFDWLIANYGDGA